MQCVTIHTRRALWATLGIVVSLLFLPLAAQAQCADAYTCSDAFTATKTNGPNTFTCTGTAGFTTITDNGGSFTYEGKVDVTSCTTAGPASPNAPKVIGLSVVDPDGATQTADYSLAPLTTGECGAFSFTSTTQYGAADLVTFVIDAGSAGTSSDGGAGDDPSVVPAASCAGGFLPVELTSFTAHVSEGAAILRWETASETNNAGFEVQQRNGEGFTALDFVEGAGTTTAPKDYAYRVEGLAAGRHVFRLKQIDFDGAFEFSPEIEAAVELPAAFDLSEAYPNPFNPRTSFSLTVKQAQHVRIELLNALGQYVATIHEGSLSADEAHAFTIEAATLPSGLYLYRAVGEYFVATNRVTLLK